ncbi:hypothetical protein [Alteromonas sp. KS69]|uniref:hypothetical protein n=1 Tax=Alteromonas sp. KS69 TaxID=2109917 RepID=UPI000F886243|nr:hypothetical protein [Alteromonas sp. KS69]
MSEMAGYRTVFYQCRHTFITNLMLICSAKIEIATEMTCYDATQVEQIKKVFCINPSTILDQISGFVGHLSPRTTLTSYAHRVHFCLINYLEKGYHNISLKALSKLMNIRQSDLKRKVHIDGLNTKDDEQDLIKHVKDELKKYVKIPKITNQNAKSLNILNTEHWKPLAPTLGLAAEIGRYLSLSLDEKTVAEGLSVDIKFCEGVKHSIFKLKDDGFVATHQQAEKKYVDADPSKITIPSIKPMTYDETMEIAKKLLPLQTNYEDYDAVAEKFLLSPVTKPYVLFSNADELVKMLKALKVAVPFERWKVKYESVFNQASSKNIEKIEKILPENNVIPSEHTVQDAVKYPEGRYYLYHRHMNEQEYIEEKAKWEVYSDNVVRTAIYWAEIFHLSIKANIHDSIKSPHIEKKAQLPEQLSFLDDLE